MSARSRSRSGSGSFTGRRRRGGGEWGTLSQRSAAKKHGTVSVGREGGRGQQKARERGVSQPVEGGGQEKKRRGLRDAPEEETFFPENFPANNRGGRRCRESETVRAEARKGTHPAAREGRRSANACSALTAQAQASGRGGRRLAGRPAAYARLRERNAMRERPPTAAGPGAARKPAIIRTSKGTTTGGEPRARQAIAGRPGPRARLLETLSLSLRSC